MTANLTFDNFYQNAEKSKKYNDVVSFMENIGSAKAIAIGNDRLYSKAIRLHVTGLFSLSKYQETLKVIPEALLYCADSNDYFAIKSIEGLIYLYFGELSTGLNILLELQEKAVGSNEIVEGYLNLFTGFSYRFEAFGLEKDLKEMKKYLDLIELDVDSTTNYLKSTYLNNVGVYYYYKRDLEKSIEYLEEAAKYYSEEKLPFSYRNIASTLIEFEKDGISEKTKNYLREIEIIGTKYQNYCSIGRGLYLQALVELGEDQVFTALDTLNLAFEYFMKAERYSIAVECLEKSNEILNNYTSKELKSLKHAI